MEKKAYMVKLQGTSILLYLEGDKTIKLGCEMLNDDDFDLVVYCAEMKSWEPPFEKEVLTEGKRKEIIRNIKSDLKSHGIRADFET